ncbi:hypothetical protein F1654_07390 [Alkalicaulis satelles]|uniref:DUF4175 domain-containing protein n=1 Tax=Alkalicaulis satelles TaxID=2609175 RepID=A0A5M6ZIV1_9PROT|nr:hypothetical protein [Alkalicaulis satelles]KAA5803617.1 hypothetical protein F1654_07390 [Alkalicaulis satelles]
MKKARPGWLPPANIITMIVALAVFMGLIMWVVLGGWVQGFLAGIAFAAAFWFVVVFSTRNAKPGRRPRSKRRRR